MEPLILANTSNSIQSQIGGEKESHDRIQHEPLLRGGVHRAIDPAEFVDRRAAVNIQFAGERMADATVKERVERSVGKPYIYSVALKVEYDVSRS